ncbi:FCD domain-containing protein [Pusillimonas sp. TS35]|uniref:GntR family transcriptional regulator n=1 Tax=Paracandidimonas lactea TaxID=2895524 RepID=UPI00136F2315|nr:GntR family transcriptional regulator [Paracandidimonas lactea]MYN14788.1 FCD domain-containing protein [Pusillimonas sp. TS35]
MTTSTPISRKSNQSGMDSELIYQRIQRAIMERRLLPGAKLGEERLAEVTGASRMRVRQVLARLAHEQIVTLVPNRGAYVARPSVEEAREMFETRRLIEPPLAAKLAHQATPANVQLLRAHLAQEQLARTMNDQRRIIRLSGEFHIHMVSMVASSILLRLIRELTSLTCLIITLYDKPNTPACQEHEHATLVDLIAAGDAQGAEREMLAHLTHIEHTLELDVDTSNAPDFDAIFRDSDSALATDSPASGS